MKEKIINYIEQLEAKSLQIDDYFKQRNDLYIENQRLNNIINEIRRLLKEEYYQDIAVGKILRMIDKDSDKE